MAFLSLLSSLRSLQQPHNPNPHSAGIPQPTQTTYREGVSCSDSIFAGLEASKRFVSNSAFDTVEFCVLLETSFTPESRENAGGYSVPGITT